MGFAKSVAYNNKKGFTLLEAVVAIIILGITLGAMLGTFIICSMSASKAKHNIEAMNHLRAGIELLRDDLSVTLALPDGDIKTLDGAYTSEISDYATGVKKVVLTLTWNERSFGSTTQITKQVVSLVRQ